MESKSRYRTHTAAEYAALQRRRRLVLIQSLDLDDIAAGIVLALVAARVVAADPTAGRRLRWLPLGGSLLLCHDDRAVVGHSFDEGNDEKRVALRRKRTARRVLSVQNAELIMKRNEIHILKLHHHMKCSKQIFIT